MTNWRSCHDDHDAFDVDVCCALAMSFILLAYEHASGFEDGPCVKFHDICVIWSSNTAPHQRNIIWAR